jgi:gamma-glutamyl-gamma-aminobutyrate hydrolase PuuD
VKPRRPPRIGLSANFFHPDHTRPVFKGKRLLYLDEAMSHWVSSGGALTYLVPTVPGTGSTVHDLVEDLDGLVLQGGADVCPRTYGEEPMKPEWEGDEHRDRYEIELIHRFREAGKPVLGVCRGAQIVNVAFGGTLYQDIATQVDTDLEHRDWEPYDENRHEVELVEGTALAELYPGVRTATINSVHHQSVKDLGDELVVEARSADDGVVEAIRLADGDGSYVAAVQWHPEWMGGRDDLLSSQPILDEFLERARQPR